MSTVNASLFYNTSAHQWRLRLRSALLSSHSRGSSARQFAQWTNHHGHTRTTRDETQIELFHFTFLYLLREIAFLSQSHADPGGSSLYLRAPEDTS